MFEGAVKAGLNAKVAVLHYWMDIRFIQREAIFILQEPSTAVEHHYICFLNVGLQLLCEEK